MPAFGLNRFTQAYAVAANDAGTRIPDKPLSCVNKLVSDLWKWAGYKPVTQIFRFLYPFVGGTAVSNSINLADPTTGRIEWQGEPIHNANGVTGNIVDAVGATGVTLTGTAISDAYVMFGMYSRTASTGSYLEITNYSATKPGLLIYARYTDGTGRWYIGTGMPAVAVANSQGLFTAMRRTNAEEYGYRNGVLMTSATTGYVAVDPPIPLYLLARPISDDPEEGFQQFTNRNLAFAFLTYPYGNAGLPAIMSTAKNLELYNYVQSFQTKLGRQV